MISLKKHMIFFCNSFEMSHFCVENSQILNLVANFFIKNTIPYFLIEPEKATDYG